MPRSQEMMSAMLNNYASSARGRLREKVRVRFVDAPAAVGHIWYMRDIWEKKVTGII